MAPQRQRHKLATTFTTTATANSPPLKWLELPLFCLVAFVVASCIHLLFADALTVGLDGRGRGHCGLLTPTTTTHPTHLKRPTNRTCRRSHSIHSQHRVCCVHRIHRDDIELHPHSEQDHSTDDLFYLVSSMKRRKVVQQMIGSVAKIGSIGIIPAVTCVIAFPLCPHDALARGASGREGNIGNGANAINASNTTNTRRKRHSLKSNIVQKLWDLDDNRLLPNVDYIINVQAGKIRGLNGEDVAPKPLFSYVNPFVLQSTTTNNNNSIDSSNVNGCKYKTFQLFQSLLDNYNADESFPESTTPNEEEEIQFFLNAIMDTRVMKFCHEYCYERQRQLIQELTGQLQQLQQQTGQRNSGSSESTGESKQDQIANNQKIAQINEEMANLIPIPKDREGFIQLLHSIWFDYYRRSSRKKNSCGFEHVFVGEFKPSKSSITNGSNNIGAGGVGSDGSSLATVGSDGAVVGFHNWIQFYLEEQKGNLNYFGVILPSSRSQRGDDNSNNNNANDGRTTTAITATASELCISASDPTQRQILTLQFQWNSLQKPLSTMFIGTSPEFEIALYTMAFLVGEGNNRVRVDTRLGARLDARSDKHDGGSDGGGVDSNRGSLFDLNIKCFRINDENIIGDDGKEELISNDSKIKGRIASAFVEDLAHC